VLGLSVNLAVQYLLNPKTSHWVLVHGMAARLDAVEAMRRRRAMEETRQMSRSSISSFAFTGAAEQLRLLKLAGIVEPLLKQRQLQFTAEIILMDRLVTAAAALENWPAASGERLRKKAVVARGGCLCALAFSHAGKSRAKSFHAAAGGKKRRSRP